MQNSTNSPNAPPAPVCSVETDFAVFDRLPKSVRKAITESPRKWSAVGLRRLYATEHEMLARINAGNARVLSGVFD